MEVSEHKRDLRHENVASVNNHSLACRVMAPCGVAIEYKSSTLKVEAISSFATRLHVTI
jgi:hypothetical protein